MAASHVRGSTREAPVITGQSPDPVVIDEDQPFTITFSHLLVDDPDSNYPTGFDIIISSGNHYTVSDDTIIPEPDYAGPLSVSVAVSDGSDQSNDWSFQITVTAVNDVPEITAQTPDPLTTTEEQSITIDFANLTVGDPDHNYPNGFTLTVLPGSDYTVSGTTVIPDAEYAGPLSVQVTVKDGVDTSDPFTMAVQVSAVNDKPVIDAQVPDPITTAEEVPVTIELNNFLVTDPDDSYPADFTLTIHAGSDYTVSGTTTIIPDAEFSGTLHVPVTVNDGAVDSDPFILQVEVSGTNDKPEITGQSSLSVDEDHSITILSSHLQVSDNDNQYPNGFTMNIASGTDYTVSGTIVTPNENFFGDLLVPVTVNDGTDNSDVYMLEITVTSVNDLPEITGHGALTVAEDHSLTLQLSDLTVTDEDNTYSNGFSIIVMAGANYSFSGSTITPVENFNGNLSVNVRVNDGTDNSAVSVVQISVTPVNDEPEITAQQPLTINEDQLLTLAFDHLVVDDPDNTYPSGFSLQVFAGTRYTVSGSTITPDRNFQGTLTVPVQVNDGALNSNVFEVNIIVNGVNDPPVITGQTPVSTDEDTPVTISLANLTVLDSDNSYPSGFSLSIAQGMNYSVSGFTITPAQDFSGTLNVSVTVNDGTSTSDPFTFQIQVGDSNDPPVITGQRTLSTNEETSFALVLPDLTVTDPDNPYPSGFSLLISPGANFAVANNTITPALNFFGKLTIPLRVNDGVNNSATFNLTLTVNPVNDAPSFDALPNQSVAENATPADVMITKISKGPGEDAQQLTLVATSGNTAVIPNPVITYNGSGSTAILRYRLVANASGVVPITVTAIDNGSTGAPHQNTYSASFQVNVSEINSAPTLDVPGNLAIPEDADLRTIPLRGITAGAGESQPLSIEASTNNPELFEVLQVVYTSPEATGSLQVKSKPNAFGTAVITVKVTDNGSSTSPSVNFVSRSFTLTVNAVNDPPVFVSTPVSLSAVNEAYEYIIEINDLENNSLPFAVQSKPSWVSFTNMGNGRARLSGVPPANAVGSYTVKVIVTDGELIVQQEFTLIVNTRPTVERFTINTNEDTNFTFQGQFQQAYKDAENQPMASILITQLPSFGTLTVASMEIKANDTIVTSDLSSLIYKPDLNHAGQDAFYWKGFDGYHHSVVQAAIDIVIRPVNDPPVMLLETDTLLYEVNAEPAPFTSLFAIEDPDNDSLMHAEVSFGVANFVPEYDVLSFQNMSHIKGFYDYTSGKLSLTGEASLSEYEQAIRSIMYTHLNTLDPDLKMKSVFVVLNDGQASSEEKSRLIQLQYTFIELEIPSGFTPNGDQANDNWIISRPGGLEQLINAEIKVFNRRGIEVYRTKGFDSPWDGTQNGQALPADTYFYTIDLNLRSKRTYQGVVTILR